MNMELPRLPLFLQFVWILTIFLATVIKGQVITTTPENTHGMVGQEVTFDCTISQEGGTVVHVWREVIDGNQKAISVSGIIQPGYEDIFVLAGTNLKLLNASLDRGHQYVCEESVSQESFSAQLIVLESDPVCTGPTSTIVVEGTTLTYECRISYSGIWGPQMSWDGSITGAITGDDSDSTDSLTVSKIELVVTKDNNGEIISCLTNFGELDPAPGANEATNKPTYSENIEWGALQVHYPPRDTSIVNSEGGQVGESIYPGEELSCTSVSNPMVSEYNWTLKKENSTAEIVGDTESVTVQEDWLGDVTLECTVRNKMGENGDVTGEDSANVSFNVYTTTPPPTTTPTTTVSTSAPPGVTTEQPDDPGKTIDEPGGLSAGAIAGICVAAVVVIAILVLVAICCLRKSSKEKDAEATKPPKSAYADQVRHPSTNSNSLEKPPQSNVSTIDRQGPPPYNGDFSYDSQDLGYVDPHQDNPDGNMRYGDFAFDDQPRSRKPLQLYEPSEFVG